MRWRRANDRVRRVDGRERLVEAASARRGARAAPCSRSPARAVRERPAPRSRVAPRRRGPPARIAVDPRLDPAGEDRSREPRHRPIDTGNTVGAERRRRRARTTRTARPVSRITSSARTMRRTLCGSIRAAADRVELRRAPRTPRRRRPGSAVRASSSARSARSSPGKREVVDDGLHVQAGAADEERAAARAPRCRRPRRAPPPGTRPTRSPRPASTTSIRWCGTAAARCGRRLRGADVHAPVHLHRVDRHDLDVAERSRDRERELRLARRGRPDEGEVRRQPAVTGIRTLAGTDPSRSGSDELAGEPVRRGAA